MSTVDPAPQASQASLEAIIAGLRAGRFAHGLRCPHCPTLEPVQRWGRFAGRQRYRCGRCRRTFSDLTGTPPRYTKKLELWPAYAACLRDGLSVRSAAARVGIHPSSAFRWRHRLLRGLNDHDRETLAGWIEVTSVRFAHSEKGARRLPRPPRRRGLRLGRRHATRAVAVLLACDRLGSAITAVANTFGTGTFTSRNAESALGDRIATNSVLTADQGKFGPAGVFARRRGLAFHDARRDARSRRPLEAHTTTARAYRQRLLAWIRRFRGVSTAYLPNYLVWHRTVDVVHRRGIDRVAMRWPLDPADPS
jgi:transposase-like protein